MAIPRTMTASVCVAAFPPMPATTGMKTARDTTLNRALEELDDRRGNERRDEIDEQPRQPLAKRFGRRRENAIVARNARQAVDVLGRLVLDDVDDVVDGNDADQLVLLVNDGDRQQVVGGDLARDFLLIRVDPGADRSVVMIRLSGVSGGTSSRRRNETTPTRCRRPSMT